MGARHEMLRGAPRERRINRARLLNQSASIAALYKSNLRSDVTRLAAAVGADSGIHNTYLASGCLVGSPLNAKVVLSTVQCHM